MSRFDEAQERDMILFIGSYLPSQQTALAKLSKLMKKQLTACVIVPIGGKKTVEIPKTAKAAAAVVILECDTTKETEIAKSIKPYRHRFLAVTCRAERNVPMLKRIIPHVPYLNTPSEKSLDWTTDKIKMRQMLRAYDRTISPKFVIAHDASKETLDRIEKKVGFPLVIKPSGLAASLLVSLCYHREELEESLKKTVKKIDAIYKKKQGRGEPQILIEEFMEGSMYSIDSYVNQRGTVYHTPLVHVRTGRAVGFEDFFGYMRITPVKLQPHRIDDARHVAEKAIEALGLRSTNCHIELMRTEDGWKIIELGPRMGGFRHEMYELSYGFDHSLNDMLIRIPKKPILTKKARGYTAVMQFYSHKKGRLESLEGINKVRRLESFSRITIKKKIGEMCDFARNGDDPVFDIVLFNKDRSRLLADVRRLEQTVKIKVKTARKTTTKTAS